MEGLCPWVWSQADPLLDMHYSFCLNPIDLLLSRNLISNPIPFVIQCPSPQHHASFTCAAWLTSAIRTIPMTLTWVIFRPLNTCLLSRVDHLTPRSSSTRDPAPHTTPLCPEAATKAVYHCNVLLIVHLGGLLIKPLCCFCVFNKANSSIVVKLGASSAPVSGILFACEPLSGNMANDEAILTCTQLSGWNKTQQMHVSILRFHQRWEERYLFHVLHPKPTLNFNEPLQSWG